jgi:hypothetical protein
MDAAFAEVMTGQVAKRKKPTKFSSDFRMPFLPNGELDRQALFEMHDSAIHNKYVQSRRATMEPSRTRKPSNTPTPTPTPTPHAYIVKKLRYKKSIFTH